MAACSKIKADGTRCKSPAMTNSEWCVSHDPARQVVNKINSGRGGRRAGRGRASSELKRLQQRFEELAALVESGIMDRAVGMSVAQILNFARACVRDSIAAKEQEELAERLEMLEQDVAERDGHSYSA